MKTIKPYLTFNGNCKEAMNYYQSIFGGELMIHNVNDSDHKEYLKEKDSVLHATLNINGLSIMASDSWKNQEVNFGNSVYISIDCSSIEEIANFFNELSKEAKAIKMPLADTFWNAKFGILTDKFGICWMFNFDYPKI